MPTKELNMEVRVLLIMEVDPMSEDTINETRSKLRGYISQIVRRYLQRDRGVELISSAVIIEEDGVLKIEKTNKVAFADPEGKPYGKRF